MNAIKLNDQLSFSVEQEEKRLRLIVSNDQEELVCHKSNRNEIERFFRTENNHLFKGRLQLGKNGNHISIIVKDKIAGVINLVEFERLVNTANPISI